MKAKVLVVGAVFLALAAVTASLRPSSAPAPARPPAPPSEHPAMASYRVFEEARDEQRLAFRGVNYRADVTPEGLRFEGDGRRLTLRARRVEHGAAAVDLSHAAPARPRFAAAAVDRGAGVVEEFLFENRRAEQIVRIERPIGEGALTVRVAATGDFHDVREIAPGGWQDTTFRNGGLSFRDASGVPVFAYHTAVAIDAKGRRQEFQPRWTGGEIALEVPASFMKDAAYPVLVDPFLELDFSASGGGISNTGTVSEAPAMVMNGGNPAVAWSDESDGDFDIYFRYWNGFEWSGLGTSSSPGGVSNTPGRSINPSLAFWEEGPVIAWEDDTDRTVSIYLRAWTGSDWAEFAGSTTTGGVSRMLGVEARKPQVDSVLVHVNNAIAPDEFKLLPVVVWEAKQVGILCRFFYPGDDRLQAPPADWYAHPAGLFVSSNPSAARPSMRVNGANQVCVAWEESTGTEYEILYTQSELNAAALSVTAGAPVPGPASEWEALSGTAGADLVSPGGGALSIQASLAIDGNNDAWVAWQESVGVEREIFAATSADAFGSPTNVSQTGTGGGTGSSFPSIGVNTFGTPRPIVAWEEDAGGNFDIHVRRGNSTGTVWTQVGDTGSSLPIGAETVSSPGGISRNSTFSLQPVVAVGSDGSTVVAWRDGSLNTFDLFLRRFHDNEPSDMQVREVTGDPLTTALNSGALLPLGATTQLVNVDISAVLVAESAAAQSLRLQIELRPITSVLTGHVTHESGVVTSGTRATIRVTGLPNNNYHWRARTLDVAGQGSPWVSYGGNADGGVDFRVNTASVPGAGPPNVVNPAISSSSKDKCGLLGVEALALLGLALLRRGRRKA